MSGSPNKDEDRRALDEIARLVGCERCTPSDIVECVRGAARSHDHMKAMTMGWLPFPIFDDHVEVNAVVYMVSYQGGDPKCSVLSGTEPLLNLCEKSLPDLFDKVIEELKRAGRW